MTQHRNAQDARRGDGKGAGSIDASDDCGGAGAVTGASPSTQAGSTPWRLIKKPTAAVERSDHWGEVHDRDGRLVATCVWLTDAEEIRDALNAAAEPGERKRGCGCREIVEAEAHKHQCEARAAKASHLDFSEQRATWKANVLHDLAAKLPAAPPAEAVTCNCRARVLEQAQRERDNVERAVDDRAGRAFQRGAEILQWIAEQLPTPPAAEPDRATSPPVAPTMYVAGFTVDGTAGGVTSVRATVNGRDVNVGELAAECDQLRAVLARLTAEHAALREEREVERALLAESRHDMGEVAAALHPHWNGEEGHTYIPDQLPDMVCALIADRDAARTALAAAEGCAEQAERERDEAQAQLVIIRRVHDGAFGGSLFQTEQWGRELWLVCWMVGQTDRLFGAIQTAHDYLGRYCTFTITQLDPRGAA